MSEFSNQEEASLSQIRNGAVVERMPTGRRRQPFIYLIKGWGTISPATFTFLRNAGFVAPVNDGETVLSLPRFYKGVKG